MRARTAPDLSTLPAGLAPGLPPRGRGGVSTRGTRPRGGAGWRRKSLDHGPRRNDLDTVLSSHSNFSLFPLREGDPDLLNPTVRGETEVG